ncbi:unnamed protein product [[Candida] boidinii]|uniref:Unnamed protein product n=1 Tax=Candida boidinii TaxID=5477 RepID=A0A9W6T709_CANBO|nr:unnamed protein product [[Candida] boidinii]GME81863.1 unnamed protein product [[Candida] boidinii]
MQDTYEGSPVSVPKQSHLANYFYTVLFSLVLGLCPPLTVLVGRLLSANHTCDLVDLPSGGRAIGYCWVFNIKESASPPIYKARPVAQGCRQVQDLDYQETLSPVMRYGST